MHITCYDQCADAIPRSIEEEEKRGIVKEGIVLHHTAGSFQHQLYRKPGQGQEGTLTYFVFHQLWSCNFCPLKKKQAWVVEEETFNAFQSRRHFSASFNQHSIQIFLSNRCTAIQIVSTRITAFGKSKKWTKRLASWFGD